MSPGASRMNARMSAAPTTPVSCVREPACSATGVRDDDAETGNPPRSPPAMLARPMPAISWLPSTLSPRRAANVRESTRAVGEGDERDARPPGAASAPTSDHCSPSSAGAGRPCGSAPTTGSASDSPSTPVRTIDRTTTTSTPGTGDFTPLEHEDDDERADAERDRERLRPRRPRWPARSRRSPPHRRRRRSRSRAAWGSATTITISAMRVEVADADRLRQQVGDEPEARECRRAGGSRPP